MTSVTVAPASAATAELLTAFHRLIPQLSSSSTPISTDQLAEMIAADSTTIFVATKEQKIVGLLTLVVFRIPTGVRAWIEDVVVDESARGHGVGEALNRAALDDARRRGAKTVDLTSRPSRAAANRLYQRLGFVARETNVYRFTLDG
jgi:ribosomal protein S18 acetylase RimI-like enzyme